MHMGDVDNIRYPILEKKKLPNVWYLFAMQGMPLWMLPILL